MKASSQLRTAVLAGALFVYITAEMFPIGVLADMSADLHTSEAGVGSLLTIYAAIAGVAILPTVALTRRTSRRGVLVGSLIALAVAQAALAVAPNLPWALAARAIAAVPHGLLWSTVPIVAAALAPPQRQGRATAHVFVGGSLGLVAGAPLMTYLAAWLSWRTAAGILAAGALVLAVLLWVVLRNDVPIAKPTERSAPPGRVPSWAPGVLRVCATTTFVVTASYVPYTYFALVAGAHDIRDSSLALLQAAYGGAGLVGVAAIGKVLDRKPDIALIGIVASLLAGLCIVAAQPSSPLFVVAVIVWGAAFACVAPTLQTEALRSAPDDQAMASALYVLAFQIGIGAGSWLGGGALERVGVDGLAWIAVAGLTPVAVLLLARRARRPSIRPARDAERAP